MAASQPREQATSSPLWIAPRYRELFAHNGLCALDDLFEINPSVRFEKATLPSWRERVAVDLDDPSGTTQRFYVKRFHRPPAGVQRRRILSGHGLRSTAGIERFWIESLRTDGVPVPDIVAFGEERNRIYEKRSALVLAEVPGVSLETWVQQHPIRAPKAMSEALAKFIARFHDQGYIHRDLYLSHIFLQESDIDRFVLIDLQRVMRKPFRHKRWLARDLAQLNYSVPESVAGVRDRLRFLKTYLGVRTLRKRKSRTLIHRIARKTARIAAHDARLQARKNEKRSSVT